MKVRKNVYKLPDGDTTLEWYAKAVTEMKKRPSTDPTSWNYQGAIHGFNQSNKFWFGVGPIPSKREQNEFWKQCQHGSWYFLPWHRMYISYFEQIVAQTIVDLGGPSDWALPFWNYSDQENPKALDIPSQFTDPKSKTTGALWIEGRVSNTLTPKYVKLTALNTVPFEGNGTSSPLGFGGPLTGFSHSGYVQGDRAVESLPHNFVHMDIGGAMGNPRTAALDPIFWLHHSNIDRLWQVWINQGNRYNPTQAAWRDFVFDFHDKDKNPVEITCKQVLETTKVLSGYVYEGVPSGAIQTKKAPALKSIGFSRPLEVAAATNTRQALSSSKTLVSLGLTPKRRKRASFKAFADSGTESKTTMLHFENIKGKGAPPIHDVYINVPSEEGDKEKHYAGALSFFGVEDASTPSEHQSGSGLHYVLDISDLIIDLRKLSNWNENQLDIHIEPIREMDKDSNVSIGRISLYSE